MKRRFYIAPLFLVLLLSGAAAHARGCMDLLKDLIGTRYSSSYVGNAANAKSAISPELIEYLSGEDSASWLGVMRGAQKSGRHFYDPLRENDVRVLEVTDQGQVKAEVIRYEVEYRQGHPPKRLIPQEPEKRIRWLEPSFGGGDQPLIVRVRDNRLERFSHFAASSPNKNLEIPHALQQVNDMYLFPVDHALVDRILPRLEQAVAGKADPGERYQALSHEIWKFAHETNDRFYADPNVYPKFCSIGERMAKYGGVCGQTSTLAYIYLNAIEKTPAYIRVFPGHAFVETLDGYVVDSGLGIAFKIEFENGKLILPESAKQLISKRPEFKAHFEQMASNLKAPDQNRWRYGMEEVWEPLGLRYLNEPPARAP